MRNRVRAIFVLIAAPALALAGSVGGARAAGIGTPGRAALPVPANLNASRLTGNQAEQTVAVNPTNPRNIVVLSNLPIAGPGLFESYTFDGGATWTGRAVADGTDTIGPSCCDPSLSFDSYGNLFMSYLLSSLPNGIPVALSTDGGVNFTTIANVPAQGPKSAFSGPTKSVGGDGASEERGSFADQPTVTTGAGEVWVTVTAGNGDIVAAGARVTGLGAVGAFGATERLSGKGGHGDYGDIAIGPDGQVVVTYQYPTGGQGPATIWTALDPDGIGPAGFGKPRRLTTTNVGGFDYIPAQAGRSVDAEANLAWDRSGGPHNGRLYAIWTREIPDESNNTDIMLQYSDDSGATWSTPVRVNKDTGTNSQFNPAIALDQTTGSIGISWYDSRRDLGTGGPGDTNGIPNDDAQIWGTYSRDGGVTIAPNFRVSQGTSNSADAHNGVDYGDFTHDAFVAGVFYPCWSDNSNSTGDNPDGALSTLDVYVAKVAIG